MNAQAAPQELDLTGVSEIAVENQYFFSDGPIVSVGCNSFYFNALAAKLLTSDWVQVSIAGPYIVFRPKSTRAMAYKVSHEIKGRYRGARISCRKALHRTGISPGGHYKLYTVKGGGLAININEPLSRQ